MTGIPAPAGGVAEVDLSLDVETADRRAVHLLRAIPKRSLVVLQLGDRRFPSAWLVDQLQQLQPDLEYVVHAPTPETVAIWHRAIRGTDPLYSWRTSA